MTLAQADMLTEWSNLSALGCLIALILWFATKGLPSIMDKWEGQSEAVRKDFKDVVTGLVVESKEQRKEFREEMKLHREQSGRLAVSGHEAVNGLSKQLAELKGAVKAQGNGEH